MPLCPFAQWHPTKASNLGSGMMLEPFGLLLHITDGALDTVAGKKKKVLGTIENLNSSFDANKNSTHFAISPGGDLWQFVDTSHAAKAMGGGFRDAHWFSVENFALPGMSLTSGQVDSVSRLFAWLMLTHHIPAAIMHGSSPALMDGGKDRGLGGHSMYKDPDRVLCPGAAVLGQRVEILNRANHTFAGWKSAGVNSWVG